MSDPNDLDRLRSILDSPKSLPVLFVGSGLSHRYLESPTWQDLLIRFSGFTPNHFNYYYGLAQTSLPQVASLIARDFYDIWWKSDEFAESRATYGTSVSDVADPLKIEISRFISNLPITNDPDKVTELEKLRTIHVHAVITTNWDTLLEASLPDLDVLVGQRDVLFTTNQAIGEIYKIHGSVNNPKSLVLTNEDYDQYWDTNPYLISKILTTFIEHPIVFLGYSIRDSHIKRILESISYCLDQDQLKLLHERLIFIGRPSESRPAGIHRITVNLDVRTLSVYEFGTDDFYSLFTILSEVQQHLPVKLLRQIQESVYELVYSTEPKSKIYVLPFDAETELDRIETVIGVGIMPKLGEMGYKQFSRSDLFRDMLGCVRTHDPDQMISYLLPSLFKHASFSPVFYPLWIAGHRQSDWTFTIPEDLPPKALALIEGSALVPYPGRDSKRRPSQTFRELLGEDQKLAENFGVCCKYEIEDILALREFLRSALEGVGTPGTSVAKLGCKYDRMVFGGDWDGDLDLLWSKLGLST